ncbi:hypothetical protein GCM10010331_49180 [Streptomyces xanthochromogenes]|uniref:hypothetical protein n=1 Tax=Streptomyces xanthochromogenes TaxID=67384 RepID=UPI0016766AE6|nr:hypothetical protein [Streptomyces xanthochromogenes]GHB55518.1 hypothetical protein GCM10010331_49180 [Streptomyces xanthochromogenes]
MSGGSYNYLFLHTRGLERQRGDLEEMAERLGELDFAQDAAEATRRVLSLLDQAEAASQTLAKVWRAVEWWDSGDSDEDQVRESVIEYRDVDRG